MDGGFEEPRPGLGAVLSQSELESADGAGDADGSPANQAVAHNVAARVQIHVVRGLARGFLAEIDERGAAIGKADEHEAAAPDISGKRMRDGESKADRYPDVHGVSTRF